MDDRASRLAQDLADVGLWSHLPPHEQAAARDRVVAGDYPLNADQLDEWIFVDCDTIAEGRGDEILNELAPLLHPYQVFLEVRRVMEDDLTGLVINGIACDLWTPTDPFVFRRPGFTQWPFGVVNQLLEAAGATVRVHLLAPDTNFGTAHLLDPRIPAAMEASGLYPDRSIPRVAMPRTLPITHTWSEDEIIDVLRVRAREGRPSDYPNKLPLPEPVSEEAIAEAEQVISYPLPPLLRRIYREIANGGLGPFGGIEGLPGGHISDADDMLTVYQSCRQAVIEPGEQAPPPEGVLFFCNFGCGMWTLLDCRHPQGQIWWAEEGQWHKLNLTLPEWLGAWLAGTPRLELARPELIISDEPEPT